MSLATEDGEEEHGDEDQEAVLLRTGRTATRSRGDRKRSRIVEPSSGGIGMRLNSIEDDVDVHDQHERLQQDRVLELQLGRRG